MKKRAFEELNMAHFFNESLKRANVNLDPPPKGLHFSILEAKIFLSFLRKSNASDYWRQCWVKLSPDLCKIMISPAIFFIFSKFWFFWFLDGEGKGQKMTHNCQFQSVTLYISRIIWNLVHRYKIVISPGVFSLFL